MRAIEDWSITDWRWTLLSTGASILAILLALFCVRRRI